MFMRTEYSYTPTLGFCGDRKIPEKKHHMNRVFPICKTLSNLKPRTLATTLMAGCWLCLSVVCGSARAATVVLSDNLSALNAFTEVVQGQTWVAAPFRTGDAGTLLDVSLLLSSSSAGTAKLDLYSGTGKPETLVGSLTSPSAYSAQLSSALFGGNQLLLMGSTTYWLVLSASQGQFAWGYTDSNTGSGAGFIASWGVTDNAGSNWFTQAGSPMQMRVEEVTAQPTPEPGSLSMLAFGAAAAGFATRRRRKQRNRFARRTVLAGAAVLPLLFCGAEMARGQGPLISVVSPVMGESVTSPSVTVSVRVDPTLIGAPIQTILNGKNVSSSFRRSGHCRREGCPYLATFWPQDGLRTGKNMLSARIDSTEGQNQPWRTSFDWWPNGRPALGSAAPAYLPAAVGLTTATPGGGEGNWIQLFFNQGSGSTVSYPSVASVCAGVYQVVALDRTNLALKSLGCYGTDLELTTALKSFTANDLVIAGTTAGLNAKAALDTTPIGGTNYGDPNFPADDFPYGYIVVGVGGSPAGTAYENATTNESGVNDPSLWARANGLLTVDGLGYYNFHPSDYAEFSIRSNDSQYSSPSVSVGMVKYTPPAGTDGFWVLTLERRNLSSPQPCPASASDANLRPNCGIFYPTGSADSPTATKAINDLATDLKSAGKSKLLFLMSVGSPIRSISAVTLNIFEAVNGLGGSGYTIQKLSQESAPIYALVSSNDTGFAKTFTGSSVTSTNVGDTPNLGNSGQTGFVHGEMGRDQKGLFRPIAASQETRDTIDTASASDYTSYSILWSQPGAWPHMDTPGQVAAYKYLSYYLVTYNLAGAQGNYLDDVRFYYTGSQIINLVKGFTQPLAIPYPADQNGNFGWQDPVDSTIYILNPGDFSAVRLQLNTEFEYLRQSISFFDGEPNGGGLRAALFTSETGMTAQMFKAMSTVQSSIAADPQTPVSWNTSKILKLSGTILALGTAVSPVFGVAGGLLNVASTVTSPPGFDPAQIPNAFADYEKTVSTFESAIADYLSNLRDGFDTILDNAYSDWGKLSTIGKKTVDTSPGGWYFINQAVLSQLGEPATNGATRSFYLQLLSDKFGVDNWPADQDNNATEIATRYSTGGITPEDHCVRAYPSTLGAWSWQVYNSPGGNGFDVFVLGGAITKNNTSSVHEDLPSQTLLNTLFDPKGTLQLQRDLFYVPDPNGPLTRREGPKVGPNRCN